MDEQIARQTTYVNTPKSMTQMRTGGAENDLSLWKILS